MLTGGWLWLCEGKERKAVEGEGGLAEADRCAGP